MIRVLGTFQLETKPLQTHRALEAKRYGRDAEAAWEA
jgi:hypothetical protein